MSVLRSILVGTLVVLLAVDLAVANVAVGANRTVLDADFVTESLDEEGAYDQALDVVSGEVRERFEGPNSEVLDRLPVEPLAIVNDTVTTDYLRSQTEVNVERNLAYLHGDRAEPNVSVNLQPVKTNLTDAVETALLNASAAELLGAFSTASVPLGNQSLSAGTLGRMTENRSAYQGEREAFREPVRATVLDVMVAQTFVNESNDERLARVIPDYDPDEYTDEEKEQMVADRRDGIESDIRAEITAERSAELDRRVDERLAEYSDTVEDELVGAILNSSGEIGPDLRNALGDVITVGVDGLTADLTYATYSDRMETAADDLASAAADRLGEAVDDQVPDRFDLTEDLDAETLRSLETVQSAIGVLGILGIVLPILAVGLVATIWVLTRSVVSTTLWPGLATLGVGAGGVAAASILPGRVRELAPESADAEPAVRAGRDLAFGLLDQVAGAFGAQSAVLAALGALLVVTGLLFRFEVVTVSQIRGALGR